MKNEYGFKVVFSAEDYAEMNEAITVGGWTAINSFQDFTIKERPWVYFFVRLEPEPESAEPEESG